MTSLNRRQFTWGTAVLGLGALGACAALAQRGRSFTVPTVDQLKISVLTDSSYDTPRVEANKWVKVRRTPFIAPQDWRRALHNEWGLALALESRAGTQQRNLLLDYGYTPAALLNNLEILGVQPSRLHGLVLSHGHYDHFGGLIGFLQKYRAQLPDDLTLYVGGEDNFCTRKTASGAPGHFADWGVLDRRELEALKVKIVYCERPTVVHDHAFSTGAIERRSFEKVIPNTLVAYHPRDGLGCQLPEADARAGGKYVADEHLHEHGTVFHLRDRGLVVISSCGHAGIVNTVQQAIAVSGIQKVHAVLGGFHLFPAPDDYLLKTVEALKALAPDVVVPLHCSGPGFVTAMRKVLADRLVTSTTGTIFEFGA